MKIYFEKATLNDIYIMYEWANDPVVRKYSFCSDGISFEEHQAWYSNKMRDQNSIILIAKRDKMAIGQLRIDYNCGEGIISYSVDKAYRGLGYGVEILKNAELYLKKHSVWNDELCELVGKVKKENIPSQRCFERLGYTKIIREEYIEYRKQIRQPME